MGTIEQSNALHTFNMNNQNRSSKNDHNSNISKHRIVSGSTNNGTKNISDQQQQQYQHPQQEHEPHRFSTVLVARSNNTRPTDLEIHLRACCQKIRIHTQLSGAHMIFPQEQGLAIRIYYHPPCDYDSYNISTNNTITSTTDGNSNDAIDDPDGILDFCHTFQWSLVLFVVPDIMNAESNDDMTVFVRRSMELLDHPIPPTKHPPRFIVVPNTAQAVIAIVECADSIAPSRCALRAKYIEKISAEHYVPKDIDNNSAEKENVNAMDDPIYANAAAAHYAKALREWCVRANVPGGEADVILHVLPTLHQLIHAINDSKNTLSNIPIEEATKRKLHHFLTARDGDEHNDDYHDVGSSSNHSVMNDIGHVDSSTSVVSPPPFPLTGPTSVFDSSMDMRTELPNHYIHSHPHGSHPYNMTPNVADGIAVGFPALATQQYTHVPTGYHYPQQPPQPDGHYFHHHPVPYQSSIDGSMYHVAPVDPSQQQHHHMYQPEKFAAPAFEHQQQGFSPYINRQSTLHQQNHLSAMQDAETMAKVVPWGQPPQQWSPNTQAGRHPVAQQVQTHYPFPPHPNHHYQQQQHPMIYTPNPHQHHSNAYRSIPAPSQQLHQPVRRISTTSYPSQTSHFAPNTSTSAATTTGTTITPNNSNYHQGRSVDHHRRNDNSLKQVVRRFM